MLGTLAQLVPPTSQLDVAPGFTLRAYVRVRNRHQLGHKIYNWQVSVRQDGCDQVLQLVPPSQERAPTVFWYSSEQSVIRASVEHGVPSSLFIQPDNGHGTRDVQLSCNNVTSPIGVGVVDGRPTLQYQDAQFDKARFVACEDGERVKVGYQVEPASAQYSGCVPIELTAECAQGKDHGLTDVAVCCASTKSGECRRSE